MGHFRESPLTESRMKLQCGWWVKAGESSENETSTQGEEVLF
jgi:hypothetical protein